MVSWIQVRLGTSLNRPYGPEVLPAGPSASSRAGRGRFHSDSPQTGPKEEGRPKVALFVRRSVVGRSALAADAEREERNGRHTGANERKCE